jgi:hypothetical protein
MMKDRQRARGRSRLAAARKSRSVDVIAGRRVRRRRMASSWSKRDDFQLVEIVRPKAQDSELQNPPKHHVIERDEHEASA